jgi:hypothetical protein
MADQVLLYISAAPDLEYEREILGRAVVEIPVSLGWQIIQSPLRDEPADLDAVARAGVHLLLLGGDIRAPIGQEWIAARRAGRRPFLFLKQGILRTPAAYNFVRFVEEQAAWQPFKDGPDLHSQVLRLLAGHLVQHAGHYALSPAEMARLESWRAGLQAEALARDQGLRGGTGESGVVLSPERYIPSEGVLIRPGQERTSLPTGHRKE